VIGLIVAMRREARSLLRQAGPSTGGTIAGLESRRFTFRGTECILVYCGIGLQRAGSAAASLIRAVSPALLISFGISGGVEDDLQVGDVVAPETSVLRGGGPGPLPLAGLSPADFTAVQEAVSARGARACRGCVVTTRGEAVRCGELHGLGHPVLDMETYGIAGAAARQGVPLISIRGLSDSFLEPLPFDIASMMDAEGNFRGARLLGQCLRHPGLPRRLLRLQANTRRAEENVTAAVMAVLSLHAARA
jgi:nucleoside phosphorylase